MPVASTETHPDPPRADTPRPAPRVSPAVLARLRPQRPGDNTMSWIWTLAVTAFAGLLRFAYLSRPKGVIFDEVYYRKDSFNLLNFGYERGDDGSAAFIVHPPLGKWCIAIGQWLFDDTEFGWRFSAAVAGTLSVLLIVRLGRRMFRSTLLGCLAGLLLSLDGLHLVQSRVALLDIFLMAFVLLGFFCLVLDRDARRAQVARALEADPGVGFPRRTLATLPWWRFLGFIFLGAACAVKWSGLYYLVAFAALVFFWEVGLRRTAGARLPFFRAMAEGISLAASVLLAGVVYLASWTGWLLSRDAYDRHWLQDTHKHSALGNALGNLWHYHWEIWNFHAHLTAHHTYQSWPHSWLFLGRPVLFAYTGDGPCGAVDCVSTTLDLGTPAIWWAFLPAIIAGFWFWLGRRDWRAGALLLAAAAGFLPWFEFQHRTMFLFYALPALPFFVLALTMLLGAILGPSDADQDRRLTGLILVGAYVLLVAWNFWYFWPIFTSQPIPHAGWQHRMWLQSWI